MTELTPRPTARSADLASGPLPPPIAPSDPITQLPLLILYPHSRCNCRCLMCDIWRDPRREEIAVERLAEWLPDIRALGVTRVVLSGGEPLMHSRLWEFCGLLRGEGIGVTLISTGILLRRDAARLAQFCDDVVVSLDGPREVHNEIRNIPRAYERLADGVAAVRVASREIRICGRCTVQRANFRALRGTVAAAHALGLDQISFLAADVSTDAFNRPTPWPEERVREVALDGPDLPDLAAELEALERDCAADFATGFIAESAEKLQRRLYQYYAALLGLGDFAAVACNAPWVSSVVEADGTVRPCFFQPPLGNVRESGGLVAVLNSPRSRAWRRGLDTHRNAICRRCVCSLLLREPTADAAARAAAGG